MLPIIFELPTGEEPREIVRDCWRLLRRHYPGECGSAREEAPVPPGVYRLTLEVPLRVPAYLLCLDALTTVNVWARRRELFPSVYGGELRYHAEPPGCEVWASTPALFARGVGDCEDIAADRAAELQVQGVAARAVIRFEDAADGVTFWHVLVAHPSGELEDPCIALGMG